MEEKWVNIENSVYQVSNIGNVKNSKTNKILKPRRCGEYLNVCIKVNGCYKQLYVHRLVALYFVPNLNNYPIINHKDENKTNNFVWVNPDGSIDPEKSNLEWCTYKYNINYGNRTKRATEARIKTYKAYKLNGISKNGISKNGIHIKQIDKNGNTVGAFISCADASRKTGISKDSIRLVVNKYQKTAGGYYWEKM